jgi:hypothetical protein
MQPAVAVSLPGGERTAVSQSDHALTITAPTPPPTAPGPPWGEASQRIHRDDPRRPRDLPQGDATGRLRLPVRRLRGVHAPCPAHTCAARWPQVVQPAVPRPLRVTIAWPPLGLALGGEAGARLGAKRSVPPRPETRRRRGRPLPEPPMPTPPMLGVDDGAMRRGRPSGPLLRDWARQRPIDRRPERPADTRAAGRIRACIAAAATAPRRLRAGLPWEPQRPHRASRGGLGSAICAPRSRGGGLGALLAWPPCGPRARCRAPSPRPSRRARAAAPPRTRRPARHGGGAGARVRRTSARLTPSPARNDTLCERATEGRTR